MPEGKNEPDAQKKTAPVNPLAELETLKEALAKASGKDKAPVFEKMGDVYSTAEKYQKAEFCYKQALDAGGASMILWQKYLEMLGHTGKPKQAMDFLENVLLQAKTQDDKAQLILRKARLKWLGGEHEEARKAAELVAGLLEKEVSRDRELALAYADANNVLGLSLWELGRYEAALEKLRIAAERYDSLQDKRGMAKAKNNIGLVLYQMGKLDEAMRIFEEVLSIPDKDIMSSLMPQAKLNMGLVLMTRGDLDAAEENFQAANKMFSAQGYQKGTHHIEINLMDVNLERGDFSKAAFWADRALKGFQSLKDEGRIAYVKCGLARVQISKGELKPAERTAMEAVKGAEKAKARETEALAIRVLAAVEVALGDNTYAETLLRRSLEIFKAVQFPFEVGRTQKELGLFLRSKGDSAESEKFLAEARKVLTAVGAKLELERLDAAK